MLEALVALCIAGPLALAIRGWLYVRTRRVATQRFYRDRFYDIAERIYTDERLSDAMLGTLSELVAELDDPRMFGTLWKASRALENEIGVRRATPVLRLPAEDAVRREWATLFYNYMLSVSYRHLIRGILLRATLARVLDPETIERGAEGINWRIHGWPKVGTPLHAGM